MGYGKALLERPEGDLPTKSESVRRREHNLRRSEIKVKATKERQSLSAENEYASVALKYFQEPITIHYQGENQHKRHEGRRSCGFSDHGECMSEPGSW